MDTGEKKAVLVSIMVVALCITAITALLFFALWQYRVIVGICVLLVFLLAAFAGCVVVLRSHHRPISVLKQERVRVYE